VRLIIGVDPRIPAEMVEKLRRDLEQGLADTQVIVVAGVLCLTVLPDSGEGPQVGVTPLAEEGLSLTPDPLVWGGPPADPASQLERR
jgi:hypothetical protein